MAIEFNDVLKRSGEDLIQFLHYCVYSFETAPIFVLLARDYRLAPSVRGAVALHSAFCAQGAPARIKADAMLAPKNLRLDQMIATMQRQDDIFAQASMAVGKEQAESMDEAASNRRRPAPPSPVRFLFDETVQWLQDNPDGPLHTAARTFDPSRTPLANLPGGRLNEGQRAFLDNVWRPRVRPQLVAAGFWRIANIGQ